MKILLVDDEPVLQGCVRVLRKQHHVVVARHGQEVLDILENDVEFDLILTGIMKNGDGWGIYVTLKQCYPFLIERVVFWGTVSGRPYLTEDFKAVGNPFLTQPVDPRQLLDCIHLLVG